jgi:hypothetical protein
MIIVEFENNSYLFSKDKNGGGYWIGYGGPKGGRYPGLNCRAPIIVWSELNALAIEDGATWEDLRSNPPKKEKKPRKASKKKSKKKSISIF